MHFVRIVLVLVPLVLVAVAGAWWLVPDVWVRGWVEEAVRVATGRDFAIRGAFRLARWPVALHAEDMRLANAPWAREPEMVRIGRLELVLDAPALLSGTVRLARLELADAAVRLERTADGRANWQFGAPGGPAGPREATGEEGWRLEVAEARIRNAELRFLDGASGREHVMAGLELTLARDPATRLLRLDGKARLDGQPLALRAELADPQELAANGRGPARLALELPQGAVRLDGELEGNGPRLRGRLDVAFDDLRGLLAGFAVLPEGLPANGLRTLVLATDLEVDRTRLRADGLTLALDALQAKGTLLLTVEGRPRLSGRLDFGSLRLDPYLPSPPPPAAGKAEPSREGDGGWSEAPLPRLLPLPLDLELELTFAELRARALELGAGEATLRAEGQRGTLQISRLALYEGSARGRLTLVQEEVPRIDGTLAVERVRAAPLLRALAGIDWLEGRGFADATLEARGADPKALVSSLAGQGRVEFRDGAILGVNLAAMVRRVTTLGLGRDEAPRRTDFARLGASFTAERGVLRTDDLVLEAPLLRVRGKGAVDLPARTLELRLEPALAATLEGQGGGEPAFALAVPVVLSGSWDDIRWRFDLGGRLSEAIRDPAELGELVATLRQDPATVRRLAERFGEVQELLGVAPAKLRELLPGGRQGGSPVPTPVPDLRQLVPLVPGGRGRDGRGAGNPEEERTGPEDLLRRLLPR